MNSGFIGANLMVVNVRFFTELVFKSMNYTKKLANRVLIMYCKSIECKKQPFPCNFTPRTPSYT